MLQLPSRLKLKGDDTQLMLQERKEKVTHNVKQTSASTSARTAQQTTFSAGPDPPGCQQFQF
jgi:hypothetical protein